MATGNSKRLYYARKKLEAGKRAIGPTPVFPRIPKTFQLFRVVLTDSIGPGILAQHLGTVGKDGKEYPGHDLYQAYSGGVLVEQGFALSAAINALAGSMLETHIYIQHPTGRRTLYSHRPQIGTPLTEKLAA